jgi:hypothetical protein
MSSFFESPDWLGLGLADADGSQKASGGKSSSVFRASALAK